MLPLYIYEVIKADLRIRSGQFFTTKAAMKNKQPHRRSRPTGQASYVCDSCGETIIIPIDLSAGESQEYVEDCPVCCRPNVIHVELEDGGEPRVWAERE
jgi:Cysteine-rich CPXCG